MAVERLKVSSNITALAKELGVPRMQLYRWLRALELPEKAENWSAAAVFEQNRNRSLQEVLAESRQVYRDLLQALQPLSDEDLNDPGRYKDMPAVWQPWNLISENTYEHYADHANDIRAWLDKPAA